MQRISWSCDLSSIPSPGMNKSLPKEFSVFNELVRIWVSPPVTPAFVLLNPTKSRYKATTRDSLIIMVALDHVTLGLGAFATSLVWIKSKTARGKHFWGCIYTGTCKSMLPRFCEYEVKTFHSSACSRLENSIFSPHIHRTWEIYFCRSLYSLPSSQRFILSIQARHSANPHSVSTKFRISTHGVQGNRVHSINVQCLEVLNPDFQPILTRSKF